MEVSSILAMIAIICFVFLFVVWYSRALCKHGQLT